MLSQYIDKAAGKVDGGRQPGVQVGLLWDIDVAHLQLRLHKKILIPEDTKTDNLKQDCSFSLALNIAMQTYFSVVFLRSFVLQRILQQKET